MAETLKGKSITGVVRPSRKYTKGRVCTRAGCSTKLSQYNRRDFCYAHAPVRFPRVRGRVLPEGI